MLISMIVAMGPKREIGLNNKLLWHIPEELKFFKKMTTGKSILMGRKTFMAIGKVLPNRRNFILSRDPDLKIEGAEVVTDPFMAFELALSDENDETNELCIIGGAEIYQLFLPYVQKIYCSIVEYKGEADAYFPEINDSEWECIETQKHEFFSVKILTRL